MTNNNERHPAEGDFLNLQKALIKFIEQYEPESILFKRDVGFIFDSLLATQAKDREIIKVLTEKMKLKDIDAAINLASERLKGENNDTK